MTHTLDRYVGSLLGLAAGDALGTAVEFSLPGSFEPLTGIRGGGAFRLKPGEWTDDTSMALCLSLSILDRGWDLRDQLTRYSSWRSDGYMSVNGRCFDIGGTCAAALGEFSRTGQTRRRESDQEGGNGSLMRLAPVPLAFAYDSAQASARAAEMSFTTHGSKVAADACRFYGALIIGAVRGMSKTDLLAGTFGSPLRSRLRPEVELVRAGSYKVKQPPAIKGTGYVVNALEAALWAFYTTENFRDGALAAANLGQDADTTAAIYGQLAGAYYGVEGIPAEWRQVIAFRDFIIGVAHRLYKLASGNARTAALQTGAFTPGF